MRIKFSGLKYCGLNNIGDYIQSIAAEQFIETVDIRINRETMSSIELSKKYFLIMNGWFAHNPTESFPPSKQISPIFWGFHITDWNNSWDHFLTKENLQYLNLHGPIGCRDSYTTRKLSKAGVDSFYSKCLTLTFPKREKEPVEGWNFIVDVKIPLPSFIYDEGLFLSHQISPEISEKQKFSQANKLLNIYKEKAKLVITSRLHCALPCIAMGIPIVFIGDNKDYRLSIVADVGVPIYHFEFKKYFSEGVYKKREILENLWAKVDWNGHSPDFENEKKEIVDYFNRFLHSKLK